MTLQSAEDEITNVCRQERIQISFGKFQLPTMSDSSLLSSEASLSSSDSLDSFSNFDKQNHTEAVTWSCSWTFHKIHKKTSVPESHF